MIRIGLDQNEKQDLLDDYVSKNGIRKVYCFYSKLFRPVYKADVEVEYIEYADIIMYKFFYRLLGEIDKNSLVVMDGCMRTQNRSDLTYNCAHHYLNQTPHRIIFEFFPIIDTTDDMMILFDFQDKGKYHGKSFKYGLLKEEDILMKRLRISFEEIDVRITGRNLEEYELLKDQLFEDLGQKDPNTIPRNLQLFAGNLKKEAIEREKRYVARNKRFKMDNVLTYPDVKEQGDYIILDMHYRRLNFNDFLRTSRCFLLKYLSTPLPVDKLFADEFKKWKERLEAIYAEAGIYQ